MKAELIIPIESLKGKLRKDGYFLILFVNFICKKYFFCTFILKNLYIYKKSCNFARFLRNSKFKIKN